MDSLNHLDMRRRAELFSVIADLVRTHDGHPPAPLRDDRLPHLTVIDRRLFVNGRSLDLARRPLMLRLFQVLATGTEGWITREDLLRTVYCIGRHKDKSARYLDAALGNAVKLVSRARSVSAEFFLHAAGPDFDWLVYDGERKAWQLVRARLAPNLESLNMGSGA